MDDWLVALILLAVSAFLVLTITMLCRLLGVWRLTSVFSPDVKEEKTMLTKADQHHNGYMVTDDTDTMHLGAATGKFVQYDTLAADPRYAQLGDTGGTSEPDLGATACLGFQSPTEETKESPVSADDAISIASSDYEAVGSGLQRAMSLDSVASESSVQDLQLDIPKIGQIEFGLEYDREVSELVVSIIQGRDLETNEVTGSLDSYVKVWLSPHHEGKAQTKVQKGTTDPVYKERFLFSVEPRELESKNVQFQVCSSDKYARHKLLGEADMRLGDVDLRRPLRIWMNLRDMDEKPTDLGDMMFSLSYLPTAERLTVVVVKARNLRWNQCKDAGDCFVKVYLLQNGKKVAKKRTSTKRGQSNPIFNEAMIFSVPSSSLQTVQLRVTVVEHFRDNKVTSIGHVVVGSQVTGTELTHWNQMMTSLRKPVAMWHPLRK